MNAFVRALCFACALSVALPANAAIKVLATTSDWGSLVTELGGDKVNVYTATSPLQDVHRVDAKPSLVARARSADLVVATGAELESGWLPVLLQESGNARIQPGSPGYFEITSALRLLDVPTSVDRSMGDVHALGNPHVQLDPRNIAAAAKALSARLAQVDAANAAYYQQRGADFQSRWQAGDDALDGAGSDSQGRAGRRHPQGPDLPGPLARHEGTRRHRTQARRAAERGVSRGPRGEARHHAAAR